MRIRPAAQRDSAALLAWRNDPDTVAASATPSPVNRAVHERWLEGVLGDPARLLYIGELDSDDQAGVGMCRFDLSADGLSAEVSINLAPANRGRGRSRSLLESGIAELRRDRPGVTTLRAQIRRGNAASRRLFESIGFTLIAQDGEFESFGLALD
jgi:UDP-2,4-diacetamido-2,4,6-trideoxy-beta-L-altropyranose hydrolase